MTEPTHKELETILQLVKKEYYWMIKDIKHRADLINLGSYSDELKSAIAVGELLEMIEEC